MKFRTARCLSLSPGWCAAASQVGRSFLSLSHTHIGGDDRASPQDEDTGYSLNITGRDCRDVKKYRELNIYSNGDCTVSDRTSPLSSPDDAAECDTAPCLNDATCVEILGSCSCRAGSLTAI